MGCNNLRRPLRSQKGHHSPQQWSTGEESHYTRKCRWKKWVKLVKVNAFDFPNDSRNFRHIELKFNNDNKYKHYRYHSDPTVYVLIEYWEFGV